MSVMPVPVKKTAKFVVATYSIQDRFRVPTDIDLNAPNISWGVKWGKLSIYKDDKEIAEIEGDWKPDEHFDWKRPDTSEVLEATDDEEEETKEEKTEEDKK